MSRIGRSPITVPAGVTVTIDGSTVTVTTVSEVGCFEMKTMSCLDVIDMAKKSLGGVEE